MSDISDMKIIYFVYDERTKKRLYESDDWFECVTYIRENYDQDSEEFEYIIMGHDSGEGSTDII